MGSSKTCSRREAVALAGGLLAGTAALSLAGSPRAASRQRSATVILVRHAEKEDDGTDDPPLSEKGKRRAEALAGLIHAAGVTRILANKYRRTTETIAPTAERLRLAPERYRARDTEGLVQRLANLEDVACALVAGHSNTLPAIVRALGGELKGLDSRGNLDEREYDRVIVLTLLSSGEDAMRAVGVVDLRMTMG